MEGRRTLKGSGESRSVRNAAGIGNRERGEQRERRDEADKEDREDSQPVATMRVVPVRHKHQEQGDAHCEYRNQEPNAPPLVEDSHALISRPQYSSIARPARRDGL